MKNSTRLMALLIVAIMALGGILTFFQMLAGVFF